MLLSRGAFERARSFVEANARPLEVARFRFQFGGGAATDVRKRLAAFQNPDGGFGNAIEPDLRAPESSALGTSMAFQVLREVGGDSSDPMVRSGIGYLLRTLDRENATWRSVPPTADRSPHAPWWTQTGREERFAGFSLTPTAELVGHLLDHPDLVPASVISALTETVFPYIDALGDVEMHDFLSCKRLAESKGLDASRKERLLGVLSKHAAKSVSVDRSRWSDYGLRPLQVADRPDSPFLHALQRVVDDNLDYEIETQREDGSWTPTWSWGDAHPDVWARARVEWAGVLTVDKLLVLRRYGSLEGVARA